MSPAVDVIAVPYDSGLRGVRMGRGPEALLAAGLAERLERRGATVRIHVVELDPHDGTGEIASAFALQREVSNLVASARASGAFPLVLSGNCNSAVGTVSGIMRSAERPPVVCWFDAHADFNTPETTTSGFLDGMAVAMLTGRCWRSMTARIAGFQPIPETQVVMIGVRDVDPGERRLLEDSGVRRVAAHELPDGLLDALSTLPADLEDAYVHVDLDVIDPSVGCANGFAAPGGLSAAALLATARRLGERFAVRAAAITAYDPDCDDSRSVQALALALAETLCGAAAATR